MKYFFTFLSIAFYMSSSYGQVTDSITVGQVTDSISVLHASEFIKAISQDSIQLIDVRTAAEYNEGYIENAINIDFLEPEIFFMEVEKLDRSRPLYIYCRSGNRSGKAAVKLDSLGFKNIFDLKGGYMNYPKTENKN